jgi:hypothetical protein
MVSSLLHIFDSRHSLLGEAGTLTTEKPDLELKALESFIGTENYYQVLGVKVTDGIHYVMNNGYSWLVTDALAVIVTNRKLRAEPFLVFKFTVDRDKKQAEVEITDGDKGPGPIVYHRQHYKYTDARRDLTFYFQDGVLLLSGEY